jgi:hypothetical protein
VTVFSANFDGVEDAPDVVIGTWDFHTAEGYLRCADVAGFVAGAAGA